MKKYKNHWDNFRFQFTLYINEQNQREDSAKKPIICQRLFDVKGYNKDVINSVEIKELIDGLTGVGGPTMGLIPNYLKQISKRQCWKEYNPYRVVQIEEDKNVFENEDIFTLEIKVDKKMVAKGSFSGNWFQKDVRHGVSNNIRYGVNIKEIIPTIISEIEEYFSRDEYTTAYGAYDIKKQLAPDNFESK